MQMQYDVQEAKASLEAIMKERQEDIHSTLQLANMFNNGNDRYEVQKTGHVWRLIYKADDGGDAEEVVVSAQGILTKRNLPPFVERTHLSAQSLKYIRQGVQITGYGLEAFDVQKDALATVLFMFKRQVGAQVADDLHTTTFHGSDCIDASNRLFTPATELGAGNPQAIPQSIDPTGGLTRAAEHGLLYTEDNDVFYMEKKTDKGKIKYTSVGPQIFQNGDIVEIQMSFLIVPLRNQKSRLSVVLRGVTLMDGEHTKKAAIKALGGYKAPSSQAGEKRVRRSVGYMHEEISAARAKLQKMEIDESEKAAGA